MFLADYEALENFVWCRNLGCMDARFCTFDRTALDKTVILVGMWLKLEGVGCASCFLLVKHVQSVTPHLSYIRVCFYGKNQNEYSLDY